MNHSASEPHEHSFVAGVVLDDLAEIPAVRWERTPNLKHDVAYLRGKARGLLPICRTKTEEPMPNELVGAEIPAASLPTLPAREGSMRVTPEQLAAAQRTREYHVRKLQKQALPLDPSLEMESATDQ